MAGVSNATTEHDAKTRGIILHIVEQIKSQGVFDKFRRVCLEELDSKEPYRQLKQRVESHVATFLSKQMFSAHMPKNQLRTSLRANINQSEVLSKGVDRLLEQVLIEKSGSFYKEIENLVEEHLISTGHYTRYDKAQRGERETQAKPEPTKLSDKEIEDIIKEETNRLLEASTFDSGKIQESERSSVLDSPPPGTSGVAIEVETLTTSKHGECMQTSQPAVLQSVDASAISSESAVLKPSVKMSEPVAKIKAEEKEKADEMKISNAQSTNEGAQCQMATNQSKNVVGQTVSERGKTGEAERKYKHEQTVASNPATVTTTPGVNLLGKDRVMDVEVQPSSSQDIPSELRSDEKILVIPETENSGDCKPDVEKTTDPGAKVNRARKTKQSEMVNSPAEKTEVDLPALGNSGSRMQNLNKKSDMKKANVEVKTAESSAVVKTETKKVEVRKVKVDKPDVAGAEVEKLEVKKAEVVKAHVGKQSMEKSRKLKEKTKAKQTIASKPDSVKPALKKPIALPILFSTGEETDEDLRIPTINPGLIPVSKAEKFDIAELSDSDITVSSVHTSDLSSLEDSMSDMEFEDYQEQMKSEGKRSAASGEASAKDVDSEKNSGESGKREESESGAHEETKCAESGADTNKNVGSNDMTDSHVVQESPTPKTEASAEGENPPQVEESTCSQEAPPPPEESLSKTTVVEAPSSAGVQDVEASDVDNETAMEDSDIGNIELGKPKHSRRISTEQESETSNDTSTPPEERKEPKAQRRSARVASKDQGKPDKKDDPQESTKEQLNDEAGSSARRLRRKRSSQETSQDVRSTKTKEEKRNEKSEKRSTRLTSDSNESDIQPSKRSRRKVKPTRCYSPSENS